MRYLVVGKEHTACVQLNKMLSQYRFGFATFRGTEIRCVSHRSGPLKLDARQMSCAKNC